MNYWLLYKCNRTTAQLRWSNQGIQAGLPILKKYKRKHSLNHPSDHAANIPQRRRQRLTHRLKECSIHKRVELSYRQTGKRDKIRSSYSEFHAHTFFIFIYYFFGLFLNVWWPQIVRETLSHSQEICFPARPINNVGICNEGITVSATSKEWHTAVNREQPREQDKEWYFTDADSPCKSSDQRMSHPVCPLQRACGPVTSVPHQCCPPGCWRTPKHHAALWGSQPLPITWAKSQQKPYHSTRARLDIGVAA